jgi:glutathione peroxidase
VFARRVAVLVLLAASAAACGAPTAADDTPKEETPPVSNLYELKAPSLDGQVTDLSRWRGKVTLAVNVASECGFTPQYKGLEALHAELAPKGFEVLGFPSNEFGGQEPGSPEQIRSFCTSKYQVTFPLFSKVETKPGAGQSPVYAYLTSETGKTPRWNFCKYLVGKDGRVVAFFDSKVTPSDEKLRAAILTELAR